MKRFGWFLLFLAAGLVALWWAVGDEPVLRGGKLPREVLPGSAEVRDDAVPAGRTQQPLAPAGQGVPLRSAQGSGSWQASGPFRYPVVRAVPQADGSKRNETLYVVDAADSRPVGEGRQQIDGLQVQLFDRGQLAAVVRARTAFAELGRDGGGKVSLREDKEFDLREVELDAPAGSPWAGLAVRLGRAVVQVGETKILVRTPDPREPVQVEFRGQRAASLQGYGFTAELPRSQAKDATALATLVILSDPVVRTEGVEVAAHGRLEYREDRVAGCAELTMVDAVRGSFEGLAGQAFGVAGASPTADAQPATVAAERMRGWLWRGDRSELAAASGDRGAQWRRIELHGAPVQVDASGLRLTAPRCVLLPNGSGQPSLLVADGGEARFWANLPAGTAGAAGPLDGGSPERLVVSRAGADASVALRAFGFPAWTLGSLAEQQVLHLHGTAELALGARRTTASRGLRVIQGRSGGAAGALEGWGDVAIRAPAESADGAGLVARGEQGLRLIAARGVEVLQLGPPLAEDALVGGAAAGHAFEVQFGELDLHGVGDCRLERRGEQVTAALRSPRDAIEVGRRDRGEHVEAVRTLWATLRGQTLDALVITGVPVKAELMRGADQIVATAPVLRKQGRAGMRLLPSSCGTESPLAAACASRDAAAGSVPGFHGLAAADDLPRIRLLQAGHSGSELGADLWLGAPCIDLHHEGGDRVALDARAVGTQPVVGGGTFARAGAVAASRVSFTGQRVRWLPSLVPSVALAGHCGGASAALVAVLAGPAGAPWLVADRVEEIVLDDPEQGRITGAGERLWLSLGSASGLFTGDPQTGQPAVVQRSRGEETVIARGAAVRSWRDPEPRLQARRAFGVGDAVFLPTVELHRPGASELLAHLRVVCRGDIDVLPAEVRFGGPVVADGITPDGGTDPGGLHAEARRFQVHRHPASGEILRLVARDATLDWTRLRARSRDLEVDLRRERLVASDPTEAEVWLPSGQRFAAEHVSVLYRALAVEATHGVVERRESPEVPR